MAANDPAFLVSKAEERYSDRLDEIAERIFSDREKRIVMLAGPSASGKTTTAGPIASRLESRGAKAFAVSLDDFYHDQRDAILDEVRTHPGITQKDLVDNVRVHFGGMTDARVPGLVKVRGTIKNLVTDGRIDEGGTGNGRTYYAR